MLVRLSPKQSIFSRFCAIRTFSSIDHDDPFSRSVSQKKKKEILHRIIRVDHAGEYGAKYIYSGQLFVLSGSSFGGEISRMKHEEQAHLDYFSHRVSEERVRPTLLGPIWKVAGWMMGAGCAMMGKEAAMACTVAVETVIGEHYNNQVRSMVETGLDKEHKELTKKIIEFRDDELGHKETGIKFNAEQSPVYKPLTAAVTAATKFAIFLSERI